MNPLDSILSLCEALLQDLQFPSVREFKEKTGKKVVGYFPVYTPCELISACDALPVGLHGAGNQMELTHADALFGSFICSIVKSTTELALEGNLDLMDALFFSGISPLS